MYNVGGSMYLPVSPWERHSIKKDARWKNNREFNNWFSYFANLYMNSFEWVNMPPSINTRFLEETLFWDGKILFFNDKDYGYMALPCSGEGMQNPYWEYTKYRASSNQYNEVFNAEECVLIRENQLMYPVLFMIETLTAKICDASRTIDVYAKSMKRPWLVTCSEDEKCTHKTLIDAVEDNELAIIGAKGRIGGESMKVYGNSQDGNGLMSLWRHKHELLNEIMTYFGINNSNTDKRERLLTNEVDSNLQLIKLNIDTKLDWRKIACDEINKKFGLNVTIKIKHDYINEGEIDESRKNNIDDTIT